jgi:heme/copper-type cytochrome/quinol oxidase subunit 3
MTDLTSTPSEAAAAAEDEGFYHESALNATWTGSRLAIGGLTFLFGAFLFAYFYLRSLNSSGLWQGPGFVRPSLWIGTTIMLLAEVSAGVHYFGLQRIKAGG